MPEVKTCPNCGASLPANAPHGLCPRCLLLGDSLGVTPVEKVATPDDEQEKQTVTFAFIAGEKVGDTIGRYKLLQKLGEGGCGIVYMAEQLEPVKRRVALKVIKLGMDTKEVIARFEAERQALALMDHPHIAKVLDAGSTEAGRPFFVMELVKGIPITHYCDENRISTRQRLELFISVCQAVQHAHQKGIIHRDIKPSNVLVADHDGVPVPKVIDFGIAKATGGQTLTDKTLFTAFEQFIGTPAYMSPEQAKLSGLDIDTRSDLYSLGVLLYELLTGKTPFEAKRLVQAGIEEICRIIREEEPPRPSTRLSTLEVAEQTTLARRRQIDAPRLVHMMRGDLDWIVMKTLEKDRNRRYETANGLASDLRRYMNQEPVLARPPSNLYRFQKLVRRNKLVFGAVTAVVLALVAGVGLSTWLFIREHAAREQARTEAARSKQVAQFLKNMLEGVGPSVALGRDTALLKEILDKTAKRVSKDLGQEPRIEADLDGTLGQVYLALGDFETAENLFERSLGILQKSGEEPLVIVTAMDNVANARFRRAKLKEAETLQREALSTRERLQGKDHLNLVSPLTTLAQVLYDQGNLREAEATQRRVVDICQAKAPPGDRKPLDALQVLASILYGEKRLDEAETLDRKVLDLQQKLLDPNDPEIAMAHNDLATVLHLQGKFGQAEIEFRQAVALAEKILKPDHPARLRLLANLATCLSEQGKSTEAEQKLLELLAAQRLALGPKHPQVAETLCNLGRVQQALGRLSEAEATEQDALAMRKELLGPGNIYVGVSLNHLTLILQEERKLKEAEAAAREALDLYRKANGPEHRDIAGSLYNLAAVHFETGDFDQAEAAAREAHVMYQKLLPDDWRVFNCQSLVGAILLKKAKLAEAETPLLNGYQGMDTRKEKMPFICKKRLNQAAGWLVQFYQISGNSDRAEQWKAKLADLDHSLNGN